MWVPKSFKDALWHSKTGRSTRADGFPRRFSLPDHKAMGCYGDPSHGKMHPSHLVEIAIGDLSLSLLNGSKNTVTCLMLG